MGDPPLQVILLGPPGAGKGTQAVRLAERFGLVHVNPGQVLREDADRDSPNGQRIRGVMAAGDLVGDDLIDRLVTERLDPRGGRPPTQRLRQSGEGLQTALEGWTDSASIDGTQPPDVITEEIVARLSRHHLGGKRGPAP